ncbi:Lead, cadmium, zinc and mercury-transporting ATPase [Meiothermus luteus]|uniref:Lead, cadmium, zinc and mercury-transporting ATPase n=1 Tax=Meiothermus luteus TaxID=2026184 RepID=A0A399EQM0_9DEIN|nr:heavy metal translocating P-type ATPase [Meiothermus luteus]RIH85853.1 Lead, cadmium, zinc and mercury-transporting ATPase [Meiothermus luteus]RMH56862.1 MAG: cadmium-translocating P-type ATPase [Deinococcota bacterium]
MRFSFPIRETLPSAESCSECQSLLRSALLGLPGVREVFLEGGAVHLEAAQNPGPRLSEAIQQVRAVHTHQTFQIEGLDCASCARAVEGAADRIPGVRLLELNPLAGRVELAYNPRQSALQAFQRSVERLGYTIRPASSGQRTPPAKPEVRSVALTGGLLALAWVISFTNPALAGWGYTAATLAGGWPLALRALRGIRAGHPFGIHTLVTAAALGAVLIGEAAEAAVVVLLFGVGELLEGWAAERARSGIRALAALTPKTALLLEEGRPREVPAEHLQRGDRVLILPGGRVPADGLVEEGYSALDESPITGESVPVSKGPGDPVYAGSINTESALTVWVERAGQETTLARVLHLVEEAQARKAPTERLVDRFSRYYTPLVMLGAVLVMLLPPLFGGGWQEWFYKGLALLLIGCPCALVISVPAAVSAGLAAGARRGLLVKGGAILETLGQLRTVAFDKTGTLTEGRPQMTDIIPLALPEDELLGRAAAVESGSNHPLGRAILRRAAEAGVRVPPSSGHKTLPGQGATALVEGEPHTVGSPRYAAELAALPPGLLAEVERLEAQGKTAVVVLREATPIGLLAFRDQPRLEAQEALRRLKALGVKSVMLTGDNPQTARAIAGELGLEARAGLLPQEKLHLITTLRKEGKVAMVGDGINDAPALAQADVGVAMGDGTEAALETADAALLTNRLTGVAELIQLSRATLGAIRANIALALGLKAAFLITTLTGATGLWMAILADTGATVLVTANALRLLGFSGKLE